MSPGVAYHKVNFPYIVWRRDYVIQQLCYSTLFNFIQQLCYSTLNKVNLEKIGILSD